MPATHIDLRFTRAGKKALLYAGTFSYRSKVGLSDSLEVFNKCVSIRTKRSATTPNPLQSHNSTFYKQIIKSLCLYYLLERNPNSLREISIARISRGKVTASQVIAKPDVKQVVTKSANLAVLANINASKAPIVLLETATGRAVLNAATHLIKSLDSLSAFDRFEKLWRAFNALYKAFAKLNGDHACHRALRAHITANPVYFPLSIAKVANLTAADIRSRIRLNAMILNNHPTQATTQGFADSIIRNSDPRVLEMYKTSLPIREDFLNNAGLFASVTAHIQAGINANAVRDTDVVSLLCIKYMYFVRNKIAHAEKTDHGFTFLRGSAEEAEMSWLAPFLEALVIDLINISDSF